MSESSDDEYDNYDGNDKKTLRCTECRFKINDPICRYQSASWGGYPIPMYDQSNIRGFRINDKQYCILCYGYFIGSSNTVGKLEKQNEKLEKSNYELTNKLKTTEIERDQSNTKIKELEKQIEDMIYYAPDGPGYSKAKEHFDELVIDQENKKPSEELIEDQNEGFDDKIKLLLFSIRGLITQIWHESLDPL